MVSFGPNDYLSELIVEYDNSSFVKSPSSINRIRITKTDGNGVSSTRAIGSLRPYPTRLTSAVGTISIAKDAQFKGFGVDSWSINGVLRGIKFILYD